MSIKKFKASASAKKIIKASEQDGSYDKSFKAKGTTYYIEMLHDAGNYVAKWWDNSDNGLGYNNKGWVAIEGKNFRKINDIGEVTPENIVGLLGVISDFDRKPGKPIQDRLKREVAKLIDFNEVNAACGGKKKVKASTKRPTKSVKASYDDADVITEEFLSKVNNPYLEKQYQTNDFEVYLINGDTLDFRYCKTRKTEDLATKLAKQFYPEYTILDLTKLGASSSVKAARNSKTIKELVLQGNYGYGWDDLTYYDDTPEGRREMKDDYKSYVENERNASFRTIERRVPNPDYKVPADRFRVTPYTGGFVYRDGKTEKFADMEEAVNYAEGLDKECVLKDVATGYSIQISKGKYSADRNLKNLERFYQVVSEYDGAIESACGKKSVKSAAKNSVKASNNGWKETDYSIFMDGDRQVLSKYTKEFDGYRIMILPEYNAKIDILSWVVFLFEDGEEPRRLEAFETTYDAKDFVDDEVYDMYIKPINSSKSSKQFGVKASANAKRLAKKRVAAATEDNTIVMYWDGQKVYEGEVDGSFTRKINWFLDDPEHLAQIVDYCNSFGDPLITDTSDTMDVAATFAEVVAYELSEAAAIDDDPYISDEAGHFEIFKKSDEIKGASKRSKTKKTVKASANAKRRAAKHNVKASIDSEYDTQVLTAVEEYINDNYPIYVGVDAVDYRNESDWAVDVYADGLMVDEDFQYFLSENNPYLWKRLTDSGLLSKGRSNNIVVGEDYSFQFYEAQGQWRAPTILIDRTILKSAGDDGSIQKELSYQIKDYEAQYIEALQEINYRIGSFLSDYDKASVTGASKSIKCAQESNRTYYQLTNSVHDVIDVFETIDEAKAYATEALKDSDEEYYDIWYIEETPDGEVLEDEYIDSVYAETGDITVEGYYDSSFRGLSDSETFDDLDAAIDYAHELLGNGAYVKISHPEAGWVEINPDEYFANFEGEFWNTPELVEWRDKIWKSMGINSSTSIKAGRSLNLNAKPGYTDWILRGYSFNGEDVNTERIDFQDDVKQAVLDMFSDPDIDSVDLYKIATDQDTTGVFEDEEYFTTFTRKDINSSTDITAAIGTKSATSDEEYNNALADEVSDILAKDGYGDVYISVEPEAITFTFNNEAIYIQPTDEITPNLADIYKDSKQLAKAVEDALMDKYDNESKAMQEAWEDPDIDDPDYATRAVTFAEDFDLEPIMGDGEPEDMGFGFDSNGDPIPESAVEELERIAQEVVDKSKIAKVDPYADLHNFNYYASIPYIQEGFDISFTYTATGDELHKKGYVNDNGFVTVTATYEVYFNVRAKNGEVEYVELNDITADFISNDVLRNFNTEKLEDFARNLTAPVIRDIYYTTTNI